MFELVVLLIRVLVVKWLSLKGMVSGCGWLVVIWCVSIVLFIGIVLNLLVF